MQILKRDFGHEKQALYDADGRPLAWYTYPALEYLHQLDFSEKSVYEYGCGSSTLFWGQRAKKVCSVEHDAKWFNGLREKTSANTTLHFAKSKEAYLADIREYGDMFDVVIIDGAYRHDCAKEAILRLRLGGMIILDNSDWCPSTAKVLREGGLIEVDMAGFGPINPYTWTTSLFLHRQFNIPYLGDIQPNPSVGAWRRNGFIGEWGIPD